MSSQAERIEEKQLADKRSRVAECPFVPMHPRHDGQTVFPMGKYLSDGTDAWTCLMNGEWTKSTEPIGIS